MFFQFILLCSDIAQRICVDLKYFTSLITFSTPLNFIYYNNQTSRFPPARVASLLES
jgi:hypothetical protein